MTLIKILFLIGNAALVLGNIFSKEINATQKFINQCLICLVSLTLVIVLEMVGVE